jgi:hypothetical protein
MFYTLLTLSSFFIFTLAWWLWCRTKMAGFLLGSAVLYFWTLHGAWSIVTDRTGGESGKHYHYLYQKVFPVYLDDYYFWSLVGYTVFIVIVLLTAVIFTRPTYLPTNDLNPLNISHSQILIICGLAGIASFLIVHDALAGALQNGNSGYTVTRSGTASSWFRLHQVLNRVAIVPAAIGFASLFSKKKSRYLTGQASVNHYFGYGLLLGLMFCLCVVLGNKNELALGLFSGVLFYMVNTLRPRYWRLTIISISLLAGVAFIDFARGLAMTDITNRVSAGELVSSLFKLSNSNESFGAHISLYGALYYDIPLTYGSSVLSFLASVVPRVFWPNRPFDIYWHYAESISATEGQGYSIHHATGWYLNFGVLGLFSGAIILGIVWSCLFNNLCHRAHLVRKCHWWRLFYIVGFSTFTANLPNLIRAGPEGYKSIIIDSLIIPVLVLGIALGRRQNKANTFSNPLQKIPVTAPGIVTMRQKTILEQKTLKGT